MRRLFVLAFLAGLLAMSAGTAQTAPARSAAVVNCHVWADFPNTLISSARNITCRAAAAEMKRYRGQIFRRFRTPGRFVCSRVSGVPEGGQWRCVRGGQAFRFEFSD
ncbi:hypothetical protein BH18ACT12_BH18ACT12_05210 [soil metagenome]